MRALSLFSGIGAAEVAWSDLGWTFAGSAEIAPFPAAVLAARHPDIPNLGNVRYLAMVAKFGVFEMSRRLLRHRGSALAQRYRRVVREMGRIQHDGLDLVVFGSPCQDLSVAGKREGLAGARSGLFMDAMWIVRWARERGARWALWENVVGALSSCRGRDFAAVVGALAGLDDIEPPANGWGTEGAALGSLGLVEWCVLDAQWFGLAQRRRRVFALADFGDWSGRPPVLLEPDGVRGDSAPRRGAGKAAPTLPCRSSAGGCFGTDFDCDGGLIEVFGATGALCASGKSAGSATQQDAENGFLVAHTLRGEGFDASEDGTGRGTPLVPVPFDTTQITSAANRCNPLPGDPCHPLSASAHPPAIASYVAVRRLTPRECERLQGFEDDYTLIPWPTARRRGEDLDETVRHLVSAGFSADEARELAMTPDGPRYKGLGNSMAVTVMRYIGRRIEWALGVSSAAGVAS